MWALESTSAQTSTYLFRVCSSSASSIYLFHRLLPRITIQLVTAQSLVGSCYNQGLLGFSLASSISREGLRAIRQITVLVLLRLQHSLVKQPVFPQLKQVLGLSSFLASRGLGFRGFSRLSLPSLAYVNSLQFKNPKPCTSSLSLEGRSQSLEALQVYKNMLVVSSIIIMFTNTSR